MSDLPKPRSDRYTLGDIEPGSFDIVSRNRHLGELSLSRGDIRMPLPPMQPGRVNFEALYEMGDKVIEAVPEDQLNHSLKSSLR